MKHHTSLNQNHVLGPARDVNINELALHLVEDHRVSVRRSRTKSELGQLHLLAHAAVAWPGLTEVLGLPKGFGTGKNIPV